MTIKISLAASEKKCSFTFLDKETYCQAPFCGGVVKERHPARVGTGQTMARPDKSTLSDFAMAISDKKLLSGLAMVCPVPTRMVAPLLNDNKLHSLLYA